MKEMIKSLYLNCWTQRWKGVIAHLLFASLDERGRMNTLSTATDTATPMFKMFRHNQLTNYQIQDQMCSRYREQNDDLKIDINIYKMEDKLWCRYRRYHTQLDIEKFEKRVKVLTEVCYVKNILVNYHEGRDNDDFCFVNYWQEWNNTESVTLNTKVVQRI